MSKFSWKTAVVYQVYIQSFYDTTGSGRGDLKGVIKKLDYLSELGVNVIWLSPFYPSPMVDGGYDISSHTEIDATYGDTDVFNELMIKATKSGIKIMIDLVANHTSVVHDWFKASKDPNHPMHQKYKEYYIWKDPINGKVPNNWASVFSFTQLNAQRVRSKNGIIPPLSAWKWEPARNQYYLHSFDSTQADLNWENPEVVEEMKKVMRFWIDRGVSGFRVDASNYLGKDPEFRDEATNPNYKDGVDNPYDQLLRHYSANYHETLYPRLQKLLDVAREYTDINLRLIFEAYAPYTELHKITALDPSHGSAFNFSWLDSPWKASAIKRIMNDYVTALHPNAVGNYVLGNHDNSRPVSRFGEQQARAAALFQLSLPGMIFIYQGEEGGFKDVEVPKAKAHDEMYSGLRDRSRTPMLWTSDKNAGFSDTDEQALWLPIDQGYKTLNLEVQRGDSSSFLNLYIKLLTFRNKQDFVNPIYSTLETTDDQSIAFQITTDSKNYVVVVNFANKRLTTTLTGLRVQKGELLLSSFTKTKMRKNYLVDFNQPISLQPLEAILLCQNI